MGKDAHKKGVGKQAASGGVKLGKKFVNPMADMVVAETEEIINIGGKKLKEKGKQGGEMLKQAGKDGVVATISHTKAGAEAAVDASVAAGASAQKSGKVHPQKTMRPHPPQGPSALTQRTCW